MTTKSKDFITPKTSIVEEMEEIQKLTNQLRNLCRERTHRMPIESTILNPFWK